MAKLVYKPCPEDVAELCPNCNTEAYLLWDVDCYGYKAYCPYCGSRLMLCSLCLYDRDTGEYNGGCDYDFRTDSCKHNPPKKDTVVD